MNFSLLRVLLVFCKFCFCLFVCSLCGNHPGWHFAFAHLVYINSRSIDLSSPLCSLPPWNLYIGLLIPTLVSRTISEALRRDIGRLSCPGPSYRTFSSTFPQRILRGGVLEDSSGRSIVPSTLAATTSAPPMLPLLRSSPILSGLS